MASVGTHTMPRIHPNKAAFVEGVTLIFDSWTALKLAVQMEFSGEETFEKAVWIRSAIVEHFDTCKRDGSFEYFIYCLVGNKVEPEDLEDILLDVMAREFHIFLEDGSERQIARMLWDLYRESVRGERKILETLKMKASLRKNSGDVVSQSQGSEFFLPVEEGVFIEDSGDEFEDGDDVDEMEM